VSADYCANDRATSWARRTVWWHSERTRRRLAADADCLLHSALQLSLLIITKWLTEFRQRTQPY